MNNNNIINMNTFHGQFSLECVLYDLQPSISTRIDAERWRDESLFKTTIITYFPNIFKSYYKLL